MKDNTDGDEQPSESTAPELSDAVALAKAANAPVRPETVYDLRESTSPSAGSLVDAASEVYEIDLVAVDGRRSWRRLFARGPKRVESGAVIISILHQQTGDELFRHIEDTSDDDDHLLEGIKNDLASMTSDEFADRWG